MGLWGRGRENEEKTAEIEIGTLFGISWRGFGAKA